VELAAGARVEILERGQSRKGDLGLGESVNYFIFFPFFKLVKLVWFYRLYQV
jgi:hypothetical protein